MNEEFKKYVLELRQVVDGYYHQQLTTEDYRAQRRSILDKLESDFARNPDHSDARKVPSPDPSASPF